MEQLALVAAIVFAGALVFCTVGFGIGVASFPLLLLLLDPQTAVVVINTVSLFMFALVIWQTRRHIPARQVLPIAYAGLLGVPVGVFILRDADAAVLRIAIATLIIALTLLAAFNARWTLPKSTLVGMGAGFVVSVMLNAFGVGGALMALAFLSRRLSPHALRGSLSLYFHRGRGRGCGRIRRWRATDTRAAAADCGVGDSGCAGFRCGCADIASNKRGDVPAAGHSGDSSYQHDGAGAGGGKPLIEIGWIEATVSVVALFLASIVFSANWVRDWHDFHAPDAARL